MSYNPYTKTFGRIPAETIPRSNIVERVYSEFTGSNPESPIYILSGVRGSGKTVTMTEISDELRKHDGWFCTELNSSSDDLLKSLASQLYARKRIFEAVSRAKINLSCLGLGMEFSGEPPVTDYGTAVMKMLEKMKENDEKLLVTIDEIIVSKSVREFIQQFQIYLRRGLPIYLIVTGIHSMIEEVKNQPGMTFLYRAPRIPIRSLDRIAIANSYEKNLKISRKRALDMAKLTRGYSFGFQLLGYICFSTGKPYEEILNIFDHEMYEKVYQKVWSETSKREKDVLHAVAVAGSAKVKDIREVLGMDNNHFNPWRRKLLDQGLVESASDGYLSMTLPRFSEFVRDQYYMED